MTYMTFSCMIEIFNMKVSLIVSNTFGKEMFRGTTILSTPKALLSHFTCKDFLHNLVIWSEVKLWNHYEHLSCRNDHHQ